MDPITVTNTPPAAPAVATTPAPAVIPTAVVDSSAELASLRAEIAENKRAAEFWYTKATTQTSAPTAAAEPEPEDDTDLLDLISTKGAKGFDAYMRKRGYASKEEVDQAVNNKAAQLSAEADLIGRFPDLRNKDSEFFRATAAAYGELKRQGVPEALAMSLGAERAELQGYKGGTIKTASQRTADAKTEKETARLARIKAQGGDRPARATEPDDEDDDELNDQELHICEAMGITPEAYKARAQKGVQMGMKHMPTTRAKKAA